MNKIMSVNRIAQVFLHAQFIVIIGNKSISNSKNLLLALFNLMIPGLCVQSLA